MLQANIIGSTSLNPSEVDAYGNILVNTPTDPTKAGFVTIAGSVPLAAGGNTPRTMNVSSEGRLHIGLDRPVKTIHPKQFQHYSLSEPNAHHHFVSWRKIAFQTTNPPFPDLSLF